MRLNECLSIRIKDLDLGRLEIIVRQGKGRKDRRSCLPSSLVKPLQEPLALVRTIWEADRAQMFGVATMFSIKALPVP